MVVGCQERLAWLAWVGCASVAASAGQGWQAVAAVPKEIDRKVKRAPSAARDLLLGKWSKLSKLPQATSTSPH